MTEYREQLNRIEQKVERLDEKLDRHQIDTEHRVTKLETKAGIFGLLGGAISGLLAHYLNRPNA